MTVGRRKAPGRPRTAIDWDQFAKLCGLQVTEAEMASWFHCSVDTISRACQRRFGRGFAEVFSEKRALGLISLRRAMWANAMSGNPALQIFLAKNHLAMRDRAELSGAEGGPIPLAMTDEAKVERINALLATARARLERASE